MTVCATAICTTDVFVTGQAKLAVIGISDRMVTAGDIEYEPTNHTKIYAFSVNPVTMKTVALGSGDSATNFSASRMTHQKMESMGIREVSKAAEVYAEALMSFRNKRAEVRHLSQFGLDLESFVDRQQDLAPELALDLANRLRNEQIGVETIIAGVDPNGDPHMYSVGGLDEYGEEDLYPVCHDQTGFLAVGSGARQLESLFMYSRYDTTWMLPDALFLLYCAKKRAEVSPGVGQQTDLFIINDAGFTLVAKNATEAFKEHYNKLEKTFQEERHKVIGSIIRDARIFPGIPGSGTLATMPHMC